MTLIFIIIAYLALFSLGEAVRRKLHWQAETTRLWLHISCGTIAVLLPYFVSPSEIIELAILFTLGLSVSRWKGIFSSIHGVKRGGWGEIFFPVGIGIAAWFFLPAHLAGYFYALLNLTFSDAVANLAGRIFPKPKAIFSKSLSGFLSFLVTSFVIGMWFYNPVGALWRGGLLALVELLSPKGLDNLTIIIASMLVY